MTSTPYWRILRQRNARENQDLETTLPIPNAQSLGDDSWKLYLQLPCENASDDPWLLYMLYLLYSQMMEVVWPSWSRCSKVSRGTISVFSVWGWFSWASSKRSGEGVATKRVSSVSGGLAHSGAWAWHASYRAGEHQGWSLSPERWYSLLIPEPWLPQRLGFIFRPSGPCLVSLWN